MAAFFVATAKVKNATQFQEYAQKAGASIASFDGELVLRGKADTVLTGSAAAHDTVGIMKFPTMEALTNWYNSDEYQAIVPLRDAAVDMTISSYNIPE